MRYAGDSNEEYLSGSVLAAAVWYSNPGCTQQTLSRSLVSVSSCSDRCVSCSLHTVVQYSLSCRGVNVQFTCQPAVAVGWLPHLLRIRKVPGASLGPETSYRDWHFVPFRIPSWQLNRPVDLCNDHAMTQGARCLAVTADGVRSQSCLYGICGIHCGTVTVFLFRCFGFPLSSLFHSCSTLVFHSCAPKLYRVAQKSLGTRSNMFELYWHSV